MRGEKVRDVRAPRVQRRRGVPLVRVHRVVEVFHRRRVHGESNDLVVQLSLPPFLRREFRDRGFEQHRRRRDRLPGFRARTGRAGVDARSRTVAISRERRGRYRRRHHRRGRLLHRPAVHVERRSLVQAQLRERRVHRRRASLAAPRRPPRSQRRGREVVVQVQIRHPHFGRDGGPPRRQRQWQIRHLHCVTHRTSRCCSRGAAGQTAIETAPRGRGRALSIMRTPRITRAARARRRPRDAMAFLLALATVVLARLPRARAAWNLQELWDDEVLEYVQQYTGDLDAAGTPVDSKFLKWEQTGWYQLMKDRSSAGMDKGKDQIDTGLGYNNEFPGLGTKEAQLYSNALRRCGPNLERTPQREVGCTNDLPPGSPYGETGSPGFGPQQYAYRGSSLGPPDEPLSDEGCDYKLSYEENQQMGYECYRLPALGGVRTPPEANVAENLGYATQGMRLPAAEWRDRLDPYYQRWYDSAPLQWGFEEGTFFPNWMLVSSGMPNFVVKKHCYLHPHSGVYQLCSAYPWDKRNLTHGLLHVRSVPFVLGIGDLTFEANGGDSTVPDMPKSTFPLASNGEGILGVALTRLSDGSRMQVKPIRARRHWETLGWGADELAAMRGEKFTLDIYDYRAGDWGWASVDTFVVPAAWIQIESVTPIGGPRAGGTEIEIVGKNFGNSADGIVVFIGDKECTSLGMTQTGSLSCVTPPGDGAGVTVSVVIGDYDRILQQGPFGGHQAGHCGDESVSYPFSPCTLGEASLEAGVPKRGFTYLDAPYWISTPVTTAQEDSQYRYKAAAADDDVGDELFFTAEILPAFMRFDPATQVISGTPLRGDVNCRSDKWHPAVDRCREGGFHRVRLAVSDYTFVVYQDFIVHVIANPSPLLSNDKSFHWPTSREI
ncbi:uncharacterized protein MICPUCDRAFT_67563, partial [Micromonas pusilla CCMP1545]